MENKKFLDLSGLEYYNDKIQQKIANTYATSSQLNTAVGSERSARESTDSSLQAQISSVAGGSPLVASSTAEMTDTTRIYVNTSDGKWYYYDGADWVSGGDYADGVTESVIQWYLSTVSDSGQNLVNIDECEMGTINATTGVQSSSSTNWLTGFIPVDSYELVGNKYYIGVVRYPLDSNVKTARILRYDENKDFVDGSAWHTNVIGYASEPSDIKYLRLQFEVSSIPFDDRQYLKYFAVKESNYNYNTFNAVRNDNIKSGDITLSRLKTNHADNIRYLSFKEGLMPFDTSDVSNNVIQGADGKRYTDTNRLSTDNIMRFPAGTIITTSNGWEMRPALYQSDGTYINMPQDWGTSYSTSSEVYVRFAFRLPGVSNITAPTYRDQLISNITIAKAGESATSFLKYTGNIISTDNNIAYAQTNLVNLYQDSACYDDIVISCNGNAQYKVTNFNGVQVKALTYLDQQATYAPHCNCVFFGNEKFDDGDNCPLFYANAYNTAGLPRGTLYAYRLDNNYSTTLQQIINIGFIDDTVWCGDWNQGTTYGNFLLDSDNGYLYAFVNNEGYNGKFIRFFKFNMPTLSDGSSVTLNKTDIITQFDVPYVDRLQGACYHNNKIYMLSGIEPYSTSKLTVVDLINKQSVSTMPLGDLMSEPECAFVHEGKLYIGESTIYKFDS